MQGDEPRRKRRRRARNVYTGDASSLLVQRFAKNAFSSPPAAAPLNPSNRPCSAMSLAARMKPPGPNPGGPNPGVAHLAGAMGVPTFALIPFAGDWRWGIEGDTTTWYPTMRLFRQRTPGNWAEPIARLRSALSQQRTR